MSSIRSRRLEPPDFAFPLVETAPLRELTAMDRPPAKLVTISAPTGYGKTVLQAALYRCYRESGAHCCWIGLDDHDLTTEHVLHLLEMAVGSDAAALAPNVALHESDAPIEQRVEKLLDALAMLREPAVVFIDNLSYCDDDTLRRLMDALVFRTPPWLYFVVAGTREAPLSATRAKLEGRLREIGYTDLAMGADDIRALFGDELCQRLDDNAVGTVLQQTEGWPAAVRLMQIILSGAEDPGMTLAAFSGSDEDLAAMLNRQVLDGFAPEARRFLLEMALLPNFCSDLCRHATGDEDAAQHVANLLRQNVFVIPLDRNRRWYRLHGLFREFLLSEGEQAVNAARRREILERAAQWSEREEQWADAMDYAVAAGSWHEAAAILERVAPHFVRNQGDLHKYIGWVEQLQGAGVEVGWEADFWYVWALVFHRRYEFARRQAERLRARLAEGDRADGQVDELHRRTGILAVVLDTYTDRLAEARTGGDAWLEQCGADDPFDVATVACAAAIQAAAEFDFAAARERLRVAQSTIAQSDSDYGVAWVALLSNLPRIYQGDYAEGLADLEAALARARGALREDAGMIGTMSLVAAQCAVETGADVQARELLKTGLQRAYTHGILDTAACGLDAAVKLWSGQPDDTLSIAELREIAACYPPRLSLMLSCFLVQRLLRLGRLDDARLEAVQLGLELGGKARESRPLTRVARGTALLAMTRIELLLADGHMRQAETLVEQESKRARSQGCWAQLVELALAEMTIAICSHNPAPAARHLARAISMAAKRRIVRPFLDRTEQIAGLVNETRPQSWGFTQDEERSFFAELCERLPSANSALLEQLEQLNVETRLLETPTAREMELLSLVEAGLSNQQLADRLSVSVSTVKWHLYNLYAKLGVSSRSAAVAKARALNLLSR